MKILAAKHGFALVTLNDGTCILVEAILDDNSGGVAIVFVKVNRSSYAKYDRIGFANVKSHEKRLSDLIDFLEDEYKGE